MIPRASRRLETTLLSSRQSLPRPARLYSTASYRAQAPATATATAPAPAPADDILSSRHAIADFLSRTADAPFTVIPNPPHLKSGETSAWFVDSSSADMLSVIDVCLANEHDVPRADEVFTRLRATTATSILSTPLYNQFLVAYINMANKQPQQATLWSEKAWSMYQHMEAGTGDVVPNSKTYAIMLAALENYPSDQVNIHSLLSSIVKRSIPVTEVVSHPYLGSSENMAAIAKSLAQAALKDGRADVLASLGHVQAELKSDPHLEGVPEVRPVKVQKIDPVTREETASIPFNIESMRASLQQIVEARQMFDDDLMARQKHMESSVYQLAEEQLKHNREMFANTSIKGRELKKWMQEWSEAMEKKLDEILKQAKRFSQEQAKSNMGRPSKKKPVEDPPSPEEVALRKEYMANRDIFPFLAQVTPAKLALITIFELIRLQSSSPIVNGMKTTSALVTIGKAVEDEFKAERCRKSNIKVQYYDKKGPKRNAFTTMGYKHLHERRVAAARSHGQDEAWLADWTNQTRSKVGAFLVNTLCNVAMITRTMKDPETGELVSEPQPVVYNSYEFVRGQRLGVIKINEEVAQKIASDDLSHTIHARHLPMVVKPRPWIRYNDGGYIYNSSTAMRFKESQEQRAHMKRATDDGEIELVYAGLDALGETPWKINRDIFNVVLRVWNSGERMGKIPPAEYDEPEPTTVISADSTVKEKSVSALRHKEWEQRKAANHSDRCSVNYKIEIARAFLGDTIYMPHNLDFRGRAYPIPPHLNHIGDDLSRSLLTFAKAKPVGERGFRWLKIHAANLYGYDKANFTDRVAWTEEHKEDIIEAATNPLDGSRWWAKADDPWQFLATCMELRNAWTLSDPTTYECSLPVHQDGTCNGLQHYAALGGDARGAEQVNLAAADKPSDVYTYIGNLVEEELKKDAADGHKLAASLVGKVSRKVVKQTVMTTVYGVTYVGARDQIERQLKDRGDIPAELCWSASAYLAHKVLDTIGDTFQGAKKIQDWLNACARVITKSVPMKDIKTMSTEDGKTVITTPIKDLRKAQMTSVIWHTPLGLPIVQPYRKQTSKQIITQMQSLLMKNETDFSEVNSAKQASAFPPNFIHSLDATHMMFTAIECKGQDIFFASVHDSYWTHACDVDKMAEIIRDTFIALHSSDILKSLEAQFRRRYGEETNHQVAIASLTTGNNALLKRLRATGTRLKAHSSQRADLRAISDIVEFTDDEGVQQEIMVNPIPEEMVVEAKEVEEGAEAEEELVEEEEEGTEKKKAKAAAKKSRKSLTLESRFIPLVDLLPPLPSKGTFRVEHIKDSQYFFS